MIRVLIIATLLTPIHSWYPSQCCSSYDCKPVPCEELTETAHGWKYLPTGNEFGSDQVKPSEDRNCHICISQISQRSLCAFIQQGV